MSNRTSTQQVKSNWLSRLITLFQWLPQYEQGWLRFDLIAGLTVAALVVATMNFGNDGVVMVVVYSLIVMVVLIPLALELGKRATKNA